MMSLFNVSEKSKPDSKSSSKRKIISSENSEIVLDKKTLDMKMKKIHELPLTEIEKEIIEREALFERLTKTTVSVTSKRREGLFRKERVQRRSGSSSPTKQM